MPRDPSGNYTRPLGTTPVDGDPILAANYNSAIDDLATALTASVPRDGSAAMTGALVLPGDPSTALQAAPKQYVDNAVASLASGAFKSPVKAATTANITLSGTQTIDGVALVADDRVLVKNQTTASGNGIYLVKVGAWVRATDFDAWSEIFGTSVIVDQGTTQADTVWICTANAGGTLGTTNVTFAQMQGQIADGTLALARLVNAGGASRLIGRGSAGGAGAWQEITLGAGLSMAAQVLSATVSSILDYQAFTTAGAATWTKPAGALVNDLVFWIAVGGGGGGSVNAQGSGGGGGAGVWGFASCVRFNATEGVTVGAGGTAGGASGGVGGSTVVMQGLMTAYGGGGGSGASGGGGGGWEGAGGAATVGAGYGSNRAFGGGYGAAANASSLYGGGGGAANGSGFPSGASFLGGGGGGGVGLTAGGFAVLLASAGGNGGVNGTAGGVGCGGAGGSTSAGAGGVGQIRVWTLRVA